MGTVAHEIGGKRFASESLTDFLATLCSETIASVSPAVGTSVAVKAALYGVFGNATSTVLMDGTKPEISCKSAAGFVLRNALVPAVVHQLTGYLAEDVVHGCESSAQALHDICSAFGTGTLL